jgi:hypothetical protein
MCYDLSGASCADVLDGTSPDPVSDYKAIQLELELLNPALLDKL